jgi:hypothetical protein
VRQGDVREAGTEARRWNEEVNGTSQRFLEIDIIYYGFYVVVVCQAVS